MPTLSQTIPAMEFGTRELAALDLDGNLLTFFERVAA